MPYLDDIDDRTPFFYRRWRSDDPVSSILLLHGFGEHTGYLHRLAAALNAAGFEVWAPDHVGHGLSGAHDGLFESVDQLVDNARALYTRMAEEVPKLPTFIVGHSLGAMVGLTLAAEGPDRLAGLVLTGPPVHGLPDDMPEEPIFSADESYIDDARHDLLSITSPDAEPNLSRLLDEHRPTVPAAQAAITVPTLVLFGEHDVFTTIEQAREWATGFADHRFESVDGGYHDILNDADHRAVASTLTTFLTECLDRS